MFRHIRTLRTLSIFNTLVYIQNLTHIQNPSLFRSSKEFGEGGGQGGVKEVTAEGNEF